MKSFRMLVACGVVVAVVGVASAVAQTPIGPLEKQAKPITPENPIPRRVHFEPAEYPAGLVTPGASASVVLKLTLDALGSAAEVRRVNVSLMLRNPDVSVILAGATPEDEARFLAARRIEQPDVVSAVAAAFTVAAMQAVKQWRYDPPADAPISFPVTVNFTPSGETGGAATARQSLSSGSTYAGSGQPVRVGGTIREPRNIKRVAPVYPPEAQAAGVSGVVILEVLIGGDGRVSNAKVLRSVPLLDQAAIDSVLQWEYTPTLLNGVPVPVLMTVTVNFTLG
jgi:protein TonB